MWKDIWRIMRKLIALILPFFVLLPLYCRFFPMYYLDDEYAMYRQQKDYVTGQLNTEDARILILGDSRTKAGFKPQLLWQGTYNIALGGGTPIEGYYSLKEYLEYHEPPEAVVVAYAPMHYMDVDTLWTRSVYFHTLSKSDFRDLTAHAAEFENVQNILIEDYQTEYFMYQFYMPNKYATALKKSAFVGRYKKTKQKYDIMVEFKGYSTYGTAEQSGDINGEAKVSDFAASDIITWYLEETIALCKEKGIRIIIEQTPMNETSYGILTSEFKEHYRDYMYQLAKKYPDVEMYPDFYCYPNDCFGDADHLNNHGVEVFDEFLMKKYTNLSWYQVSRRGRLHMNNEELLLEMKSLKKSLFINRILSIVSSVFSLVMIVVLIIGISRVNAFIKQVQVVADQVAQIDVDQVNAAIESFNETVEQIDFEYINESFKEVDMKKIGEIVETINAAELEETLGNINDVSEKLKKLSETISNFFSFGR